MLLPALVSLCVPGVAGAAPGDGEDGGPASCERTGAETRVTARVRETRHATAVVTCDLGTRRERVVRRARGDRTVVAAAATGRRVAWTEVSQRRSGGVAVGRLIEADGLTGRRSRTRVIFRTRGFSGEAGVALTRAGDLAWQVPATGGGRVILQRRGGRPQEAATGVTGGLRVVDRGTTLRWITNEMRHRWLDVRPLPRPCLLRDGFEAIHATPGVVVSRAAFSEGDAGEVVTTTAYRACDRSVGRDPLVFSSRASWSGSSTAEVAAHASPFLALRITDSDKDVVRSSVMSVDLRTGEGRAYGVSGGTAPRWVALLPDGSIAWIERQWPEGEAAFDRVAFSRWGTPYSEYGYADSHLQLDRGEPGALADLRADGTTLRWTHGGEPRSYP